MKKIMFFRLSSLAFVLLFASFVYAMDMGEKCPLCGMNLAGNENTAYEITLKTGKF